MFPVALIAAALAPTPGLTEYVIEPPDVLSLSVTGLSPWDTAAARAIVRPDGTVGLGEYGAVSVAGLTPRAAGMAVRAALAARGAGAGVAVRVGVDQFNSKSVYVLTSAKREEQIVRLSYTGGQTVLDAVAAVGGLPAGAGKRNVWVARRTPHAGQPEQILPVDYLGITQNGVTTTNYQLLPGDRVYVKPAK